MAAPRFVATCAAGCGNTVLPGQVMCSTCASKHNSQHNRGT